MGVNTKLMPERLNKVFRLIVIFTIGIGLSSVSNASAESQRSREYLIKAAFLYNFAKFVEWPAEAFKDGLDTLYLGVLGVDPFGDALDSIKDKTVKGKKLVIKRFTKIDDLEKCHILFISASERGNLRNILQSLNNSSVLTVSEMEKFAQLGGIINLITIENNIHFEINPDAAERAKLKISSHLLKLAKIVTSGSQRE